MSTTSANSPKHSRQHPPKPSAQPVSFAAPFHHAAFAVVWTATLVSNVGGWMYSAASGWLMTSLNPDPLIWSPWCRRRAICRSSCSRIPAGAFADIFDKRKYLLGGRIADHRRLRGLCARSSGLRPRHAGQSAVVHLSDRRRRRLDGAGLAGGGAAACSQGRPAAGHRRQQRRRQHFARARPGARRRGDFRVSASSRRSGSTPSPISASSAPCCGGARRKGRRRLLPAERFGARHARPGCATPGTTGICARR